MKQASPDENRLLEEAFDLIIRLRNDPDNPVSLEMAWHWRTRSPDHERAWAAAGEVFGLTGVILTKRHRSARQAKLGFTRRNLVTGGAVSLGGFAAAALFGPDLILKARADVLTTTAEVRRVPLLDGSVATLGPDSAIAVGFDTGVRRIDLLAGMAFFEVATDPKRPFQVWTDRLVSTALGTTFESSNDAGFLTVAVGHGTVEARATGSSLEAGERLDAGRWLTLDRSTLAVERGTASADQIGSWRDGMIVADKEPISALVAKIARWQPGRTVIVDPSFGSQRVSGVFDVHNPLRALEAAIHPYGGKVRHLPPYLTVISPF